MSNAMRIGAVQRFWDAVWAVVLPACLAATTLLVVLDPDTPAPTRIGAPAAVVALVGWHWWTMRAERLTNSTGVRLLCFAVLLAGTVALACLDARYVVALIACYPQAFVALPGRLAYAGVGAITAAMLCIDLLDGDPPRPLDLLLIGLLGLGLPALIGGALRALERSNAQLAELSDRNAELHAEVLSGARRAGMLDERQRLAREIHDTVAQGLTGIVTQLEAADTGTGREQRIATAKELARDTLAEARRAMQALRPGPLTETSLPDALRAVVRGWSVASGTPCELTVTGSPVPLPPEVEDALLRTTQEALANVAKHAGARRAGVTLSYIDDVVMLDVRDDGVGFAPAKVPETGESSLHGWGLSGTRQRLSQVAGWLEIESGSAGTALSATVPVAASQDAARSR